MPTDADSMAPTRTPRSRLRIVLLGYMVRAPLGGLAWHHLQYVTGLARLGHDVLMIEDSDEWASCVHLDGSAVDTDPADGIAFTADAMAGLGVPDRFAYFDWHRNRWWGPRAGDAEAFCRAADVVINVSLVNPLRPWWAEVPVRVAIDTDPAFVQIRCLRDETMRALCGAHNAWFTFGEKVNHADCGMPDDGLPWQPTRQPIDLGHWPVTAVASGAPFTTVMQWQSYKPLEHDGRRYGMKGESFEAVWDLPSRCRVPLLLGIGGAATPPRKRLSDAGWQHRNTVTFTRTPWDYRRFIQGSAGEFSVAKHGYVVSRCGWFSERSANYLASGRPVVTQDTGFSEVLPTGEGLLAYGTVEEAAEQLGQVQRDWRRHSVAARRIAETCFDARHVLDRLLREATQTAGAATG